MMKEDKELEILTKAIVNVLKVYPDEINEETTFMGDLGADSLDVYQIVMYVEADLGVSFEAADIEKITKVKEAIELIKKVEEKNGNE